MIMFFLFESWTLIPLFRPLPHRVVFSSSSCFAQLRYEFEISLSNELFVFDMTCSSLVFWSLKTRPCCNCFHAMGFFMNLFIYFSHLESECKFTLNESNVRIASYNSMFDNMYVSFTIRAGFSRQCWLLKLFSPKTRIFHSCRQVTAPLWFCHLFSRIWISPLFHARAPINTVIFRLDRHILRWKAFRTHFNEAEWIVSALVFLLGKRQKLATTNLTQTHVHTQSIPKSIPRHWQRCKSHINYFQASTQRENTFYVGCNFGGDNLCFGVCLVLWRVAAAIYGHAVHFYNL